MHLFRFLALLALGALSILAAPIEGNLDAREPPPQPWATEKRQVKPIIKPPPVINPPYLTYVNYIPPPGPPVPKEKRQTIPIISEHPPPVTPPFLGNYFDYGPPPLNHPIGKRAPPEYLKKYGIYGGVKEKLKREPEPEFDTVPSRYNQDYTDYKFTRDPEAKDKRAIPYQAKGYHAYVTSREAEPEDKRAIPEYIRKYGNYGDPVKREADPEDKRAIPEYIRKYGNYDGDGE